MEGFWVVELMQPRNQVKVACFHEAGTSDELRGTP
jgi:hypothetical protein